MAVLTAKNIVILYSIFVELADEPSISLPQSAHTSLVRAGVSRAREFFLRPVLRAQLHSVLQIPYFTSMAAFDTHLVINTLDEVRWYSWKSGQMLHTIRIDDLFPEGKTENTRHVTWVDYDCAMKMAVWVLADGSVYYSRVSRDTQFDTQSVMAYQIHSAKNGNAVRAQVNATFSLIAVAVQSGHIYLYSIKDYRGNYAFIKTLESSGSGSCKCLAWTYDGYALFVGFERNWAVWSVFGCLTGMSSIWPDTDKYNDSRVHNAIWTYDSSYLVALCGTESFRVNVLPFARHAMTLSMNTCSTSLSIIITGFSMYMSLSLRNIRFATSPEASQWTPIAQPGSYMEKFWPLRYQAVNQDGSLVAIAGTRGFAHYSVHSKRWVLFKDDDMRQNFSVVGGMAWYSQYLIVAADHENKHLLRAYSRSVELSHSKCIEIEQFSHSILHVTIEDASLLVLLSNNDFVHYHIAEVESTIKFVFFGKLNLNPVVQTPSRIRYISWMLPEAQITDGHPKDDLVNAVMVLLVDGNLVLVKAGKDGSLQRKVLAENIEYSSLQSSVANDLLGTILWAFNGERVLVWPNLAEKWPDGSVPKPFVLNTDFYVLSCLVDRGVVFGIESNSLTRRLGGLRLYRLENRIKPLLPCMLRSILADETGKAYQLAKEYQDFQYFSHFLEMLLHDVLEDEASQGNNTLSEDLTTKSLLPRVLWLLKRFPEFLDIVVQCTRKNEVTTWKYLFHFLGSPKGLFFECIAQGKLKTAGNYLIIVSTIEDEPIDDVRARLEGIR